MKQVIKGAAKFFLMFLLLMFIATYIFPENEQGKVEVPFYYAMGSYILFDVIVIVFGDSKNPFDQIAVSFAYIQKGAYYRKNAIEYFETAIDQVPLSELNRFASVSELSMFTKIAEVYEKEHEYEKAIYWLKVLIKRRIGNTLYFMQTTLIISAKP